MKIGSIQLSSPFCQAGLAGYSDRAMRLVARRRGCPYAVTEALLDVIMLAGGMGLKRSIDINQEDHPVAGQIIGSEPDEMARAAAILAGRGYDVVDLNFACPVKKIKNRARGGHMLQDLPRALAILDRVRQAVPAHIPTTVSLRRSFADTAESVDQFERLLEAVWSRGYAAARIHARTVEQKYLGRADWSILADIRRRWPGKTLLGSGDVFCAQDAVEMLRQTGVDVVWIARGAIGNPWVFGQAQALLRGESIRPPDIDQQRQALEEHFAIAMAIHGEQLAGRRMRKMGIKYSRFHPEAAAVKQRFIQVHSLRDWAAVLADHYQQGGPGVWPAADAANEVNPEESASCGE